MTLIVSLWYYLSASKVRFKYAFIACVVEPLVKIWNAVAKTDSERMVLMKECTI